MTRIDHTVTERKLHCTSFATWSDENWLAEKNNSGVSVEPFLRCCDLEVKSTSSRPCTNLKMPSPLSITVTQYLTLRWSQKLERNGWLVVLITLITAQTGFLWRTRVNEKTTVTQVTYIPCPKMPVLVETGLRSFRVVEVTLGRRRRWRYVDY